MSRQPPPSYPSRPPPPPAYRSEPGPPPPSTKKTARTSSKKKGKAVASKSQKNAGKKPSSEMTKLKTGASAAYWGIKAFQAVRLCVGDVTVIAECAAELLGEGLLAGAFAQPGLVIDCVQSVISLYGGLKDFRKSCTNFSAFSKSLAKQFKSKGVHGGAEDDSTAIAMEQAGASMEQAERIYRLFTEADRDGSATVSKEEFVYFCHNEGVPRSSAEHMFFQADIDGNGSISFEEWTKMMIGRVGRDKASFNCAGHHGLTSYTVPFNGMGCDFCSKPIAAGTLAAGCRRCDCDACDECLRANRPSAKEAGGTFDCKGRHGLALFAAPGRFSCDWCHNFVPMGHLAVGCRQCDCDGCIDCAAKCLESFSASQKTCRERHGLQRTRTPAPGYACDFCRRPVESGTTMFSCRVCEVDSCVPCVWKDHQRVLSTGRAYGCDGNHHMDTFTVMTYPDLKHRCDWCLAGPRMGDRLLRCGVCDTDVCNDCLAQGGPAHPQPPQAPATPPPPAYDEVSSSDSDSSDCHPPPPPGPGPVATSPYKFDSIVRVIGVEDVELNGKLMTVIGFEPRAGLAGEDVVVMQRRGMVVRASSEHVYTVLDG